MKTLLLTIFILSASGSIKAQATVDEMQQSNWPVAFDANWQVAEFPIAAAYYREFKPFGDTKPGGIIRDYFISGRLQMDGTTSSTVSSAFPDDFVKEGTFTWYYENGQISIISFYRNNKLEGQRTVYSENGEILEEAIYQSDKLNGTYKSYYKSGKPWYIATYKNGILEYNIATEYTESREKRTVYVENFSSNVNTYNWELGDFENYSNSIEPSVGLQMTNKDQNRMALSTGKPAVLSGKPFFYSCRVSSMSGLKGAYYGLTFDFIDWNNYKYYVISDKGDFAIGQYVNGTNKNIVSPTPVDAVNVLKQFGGFAYDNVNELEIETSGSTTSFKVNNKLVHSMQALFQGTGLFGLYIESGFKSVTFNQFIIKSK
jgi:hypothetical protein